MLSRTFVVYLLALLAATTPATAQTRIHLFPDRRLLPDLLAGPRDPVVKGQLVHVFEPATRFRGGADAEVAIAATLPVLGIGGEPDRSRIVAGLEGGVFARFSLQVVERDLINTDWVFAAPVVVHLGAGWLRIRYYHTSSHLGDEYARRFGGEARNVSRDGVDVTGYATLVDELALYGSVLWSVNSNPAGTDPWVMRAGAEIHPAGRSAWHPFLALDVDAEEETDWATRLTAQVGIWLPAVHRRPLRAALELLNGPSPMGQFRGRTTTQLGLGLFWNP